MTKPHARFCAASGAVVALCLVICTTLHGQEGLSTIRGTATDSTGGIVPGVTITAREVLTNIVARTVTTDEQGNYEMPALKSGNYQVTAALAGFKKFVVDEVLLQGNQVKRVDIVLQVGEVTTEVIVSAANAAIQTEQATIGADFNAAKNYADLPAPGNAFSGTYAILSILPDVQRQPGDWGAPTFAGQGGAQVHMAQDGVKEETLNSQTVNMEAVTEVKAVFVNNTAEYARVGYFDTITKGGANDFHGEASYYHRNSALGTRNFFEEEKTKVIYHTFNVSASGPIVKNKTFFYFLWNGERVPGHSFYLISVPTEKMRNGDFSQLLSLDDPVIVNDPLTGEPFTNNIIPASRISGLAKKTQDYFFPLPNRGGPNDLVNNYGFVHRYPDDQFYADVFSFRIDHKVSEKNSLYGRIQTYFPKYVLAGAYPITQSTQLRPNYSWVATDTHVFSPRFINTFSTGGNRDANYDNKLVDGFQPGSGADIVKNLGLQGVNQANVDNPGGSPVFNISGYDTVEVQPGGLTLYDQNFNFADNISWAFGRHVLKFGGELRTYGRFLGTVPNENFGSFEFDGSFTNDAYADFLLGVPLSSTRLNPLVDRKITSKELGLFITDTFKVTPKLTVDYGLRWDRFSEKTYSDGLMFNWDPKTGNLVVAPDAMSKVSPNYPSSIKVVAGEVVPKPDERNFVPRIGVAYRLSDKMVVRGGYGMFNEFHGKYNRVLSGGPFAVTETYFNEIDNGVPLFQMPNPFPSAGVSPDVPSQRVTAIPIQTKNGSIHQFNVSLERQLRDMGFRLSYIGSRNRGMNYSISTNKPQASLIPFSSSRRPYPQFVGTTEYRTDGSANYDSFSFEVNRRVGQVMFDNHWTWAHGMNNYSQPSGSVRPQALEPRFLRQAPGGVQHDLGTAFRQRPPLHEQRTRRRRPGNRRVARCLGGIPADRPVLFAKFFRRGSIQHEYFRRLSRPGLQRQPAAGRADGRPLVRPELLRSSTGGAVWQQRRQCAGRPRPART